MSRYNCDGDQVSGNVGGDIGGDNEDWAFWDENKHDLHTIPHGALSGYKQTRTRQRLVLKTNFLCYILM
jgi:hypothetical protein